MRAGFRVSLPSNLTEISQTISWRFSCPIACVEEDRTHLIGDFGMLGWQHVCIRAQRDRNVRVAHALAHDLDVRAGLDGQRDVAVTQVVDAEWVGSATLTPAGSH